MFKVLLTSLVFLQLIFFSDLILLERLTMFIKRVLNVSIWACYKTACSRLVVITISHSTTYTIIVFLFMYPEEVAIMHQCDKGEGNHVFAHQVGRDGSYLLDTVIGCQQEWKIITISCSELQTVVCIMNYYGLNLVVDWHVSAMVRFTDGTVCE